MNAVISHYLKSPPSLLTLSNAVNELIRILKSSQPGRLSATLLRDFIFGENGFVSIFSKVDNHNGLHIIQLIYLLHQKKHFTNTSFSVNQWETFFTFLISLVRRDRKDEQWEYLTEFLESPIFLIFWSENESLLEKICDLLLVPYVNDMSSASIDRAAHSLYCKLLDTTVRQFCDEPSSQQLRSVIRLVHFGFVLVKLAPSVYIPELGRQASTLHKIITHPGLESLRLPVTHQFDLTDVVKFSHTKLLNVFLSLLTQSPCEIMSILKSLLILFPKIATEDETFKLLFQILLQAVRLTTPHPVTERDDGEEKENAESVQPATFSLRLFVKLIDIWSQCEDTTLVDRRPAVLYQLFDLLRVFPTSLEHAEVRLRAWWHFICRLPADLLCEGFRRFVSPFLANLLGRYLSISTPHGDPELHKYKLSIGNVFEGNRKAMELCEHVFACFFPQSNVGLKMLDGIPQLHIDNKVLANHSYQLLVALVHWLRFQCGSSNNPALPCVDRIWTDCVCTILDAARPFSCTTTIDQSVNIRSPSVRCVTGQSLAVTALQHVISCTLHLISKPVVSGTTTSSNEYRSGSPSFDQCLTIIEDVATMIENHPATIHDKDTLVFDLLTKSLELGGRFLNSDQPVQQSILSRWSSIITRLVQADTRLVVSGPSSDWDCWSKSSDFLYLFHQIMVALLPDCMYLAANQSPPDYGSQDSNLSTFLGQPPTLVYSPSGLRIWSDLADRLTRFIMIHHVVYEGDPVIAPDLTVIQAMLLSPFWFAGPTLNVSASDDGVNENTSDNVISQTGSHLSNKDELALAKRMAHLFAVFHQEACLLTTIASNAWINELGHKLVCLISTLGNQPNRVFNFNLMGRLLRCFIENSERSQEDGASNAGFNPFTWKPTQDKPFGQLTGFVTALNTCLIHLPWFDPPVSTTNSENQYSPTHNRPTLPTSRILTSPPSLPIVSSQRSDSQSTQDSNSALVERITSVTSQYKVSCGLIDALEATRMFIRDYVNSLETVSLLVESLLPALSRLASSCSRAESLLRASGGELDEPLLILQRRQQAKLALEDIFVGIWRALGLSPINLPNPAQSSDDCVLSLKSHTAITNSKSACLSGSQSARFLQAAIDLSDVLRRPIYDKPPNNFTQWLVAYWNRLVDICAGSKTSVQDWNVVRSLLEEYEQPVRHLVCHPEMNSHRGHSKREMKMKSRSTASGRLSRSFEETDEKPPSNVGTTARGRSRRNRLSLNRTLTKEQTTPTKRNVPSAKLDSLTRSAPPKIAGGTRGRSRRSMLPVVSPISSPGILASHLGIKPGINVIESGGPSWSPSTRSPGPMPSKPLIKRRLFQDPDSPAKDFCPSERSIGGRKRTFSDSQDQPKSKVENNGGLQPPLLADFEDSAQFVFIPPAVESSRKRRRNLTEHQREHFAEQKQEYIPATYTELDLSQQSADSQTASQSQFSQASWDHFRAGLLQPNRKEAALVHDAEMVAESKPIYTIEDTPNSELLPAIDGHVIKQHPGDQETYLASPSLACPMDSCITPPSPRQVDDRESPASLPDQSSEMKPAISLSTPVIIPSPVLNRSNPLILGIATPSRAQRMLALGLQKAAAKKATAVTKTEPKSEPTTPERAESPDRPICDSPMSIMRRFSSRRKSQRVSFAEEPQIYMFNLPSESPSCDDKKSTEATDSVKLPEVAPIPSDHPPQSDLVQRQIDLDSSQTIPRETYSTPENSPTKTTDQPDIGSDTSKDAFHRRKSPSPHRRNVVARLMAATTTSSVRLVKPIPNKRSVLPSNHLPLSEKEIHNETKDTTTLVPDTEPEEQKTAVDVVIFDSEANEIVETQPNQDEPDQTSICSIESTQSQEVIESSQDTQDETLVSASSKSCVDTDIQIAISDSAYSNMPIFENHINSEHCSESVPLECVGEDSDETVEQFIDNSLNRIAVKLGHLPASSHQTILMKVLNVFKPLMHP